MTNTVAYHLQQLPQFATCIYKLLFSLSLAASTTFTVNLEGSDIKLANSVRNLGVRLDPVLTFQQQISSVCRIFYLELLRISAVRHYLSEDHKKKKKKKKSCVCLFFQD